MSLLFFLPFLTAAADDDANSYVHQMEMRIMAAWDLPKRSAGLTVALRMNLEGSGRISAVRVEQSSGNERFDESAVEAVRRMAEFPPVPHALNHLIGDLVIVLDPTPIELYVTVKGKTRKQTFRKRDQFAPELEYFSSCILNNQAPEPSGTEGIADVRIIEAPIARQNAEGESRSKRCGKRKGLRSNKQNIDRPSTNLRLCTPRAGRYNASHSKARVTASA
jgi:TonB family protein